MYVDTQLEFSSGQAVTATAISTNVVDLHAAEGAGTALTGETTIDFGQGNAPVYLVVQAITAGGGTGTITVSLESDSTADLATSATVHYTGAAVTASAITAGQRIATVALPHGDYERYLGVRYTCSATPSGVTFDAFLTVDPAGVRRVYQSGFTVS